VQLPQIVSPEEWQAAHDALLAREKAATRARDALAAERRRQPMVRFDAGHRFESADGEVGLLDLFEGRRQLIVYFMHTPGAPPCEGCCTYSSNLGHPALLALRDTTMALVSQKPFDEFDELGRRLGWHHPRYTSKGTFEEEAGSGRPGGGFGLSVFVRDDDGDVYRTYFTRGRGVEALGTSWELLDLTPFGRQETWEDSPEGRPQGEPYQWWQRVDLVDTATPAPSAVEDGRGVTGVRA